MESIGLLFSGFSDLMNVNSLFWCLIGVTLGTLIGALPGLGPSAGIAVLLPVTFGMDATNAVILLCGIYYGAMFGGAITSILINTPGDAAAVMTTLDGHPLAKQGRAGAAIGMATIASFIGGLCGVILIVLIAPLVVQYALKFGPAEYFALMLMGLVACAGLTGDNRRKGLLMMLLGLLLSCVGQDIIDGQMRLVFGINSLWDGIAFVAVTMGVFGFTEVLRNLEKGQGDTQAVLQQRIRYRECFPRWAEILRSKVALLMGSIIGFFIGALPGAGATIASFISYSAAKGVSKEPEKFGTGVMEGVAAPESANNAASAGAMVPLLTLGVPGSAATAIMMGALIMQGLKPGPMLFAQSPEFVWTVIASMFVGNMMLVLINFGTIPLSANILRIPYGVLMPCILVFILMGVYSLNYMMVDVWIMLVAGIVGYVLCKFDYPMAPLILALVLGNMMESNLRRALIISRGSVLALVEKPICVVLFIITLLIILLPVLTSLYKKLRRSDKGAA